MPVVSHQFLCLQDDLFKPNFYLSLMEFRELTLRRLQAFSARGFFSVADYLREPLRFQAALEALSFCDYSLAIKAGVHYTLCGGECGMPIAPACNMVHTSLSPAPVRQCWTSWETLYEVLNMTLVELALYKHAFVPEACLGMLDHVAMST